MANADTVEDRHDDEWSPAPAPTTPAEWDELIMEWEEIRHGYYLGDDAPGKYWRVPKTWRRAWRPTDRTPRCGPSGWSS